MSHDKFLLVISLVKVNKKLCHVTQGGAGGGEKRCHKISQGVGWGKKVWEKCHVLFEWPHR
jgi:hypothetical protein